MGHLFSRAFKRFTQCNTQTRSQPPQQQREKPVERQGEFRSSEVSSSIFQLDHSITTEDFPPLCSPPLDHENDQSNRPVAQTIPVGQSIDSAEYRALAPTSSSSNNNVDSSSSQSKTQENIGDDQAKQQDVEGAVIKIQALVRGHLTRKALKDAHQHSAPPLGALGQSQFDEESLTQNRK